jgi:hypothetical protein
MRKRIASLAAVPVLAACTAPAPSAERADAAPDSLLAAVEAVDVVAAVTPAETLRVRLRGVVGADGSWAADGVGVRRAGDRVVLEPRVKRVPGSYFIQMVIPLDVTVPLVLGVGRWTLEVRGKGTAAWTRQVEVVSGARRAPPVVRLEPGPAAAVDGGAMLPVRVRAESDGGWVARLEVRGFGAEPQVWRDPGTALPEGAALVADVGVLRPPGDGARRIEARAVDGQGTSSEIAVLELPARSE